jgi:hypothetical protein
MTCRAILHLVVYKRELYVPYLYKAYGVCDATVSDGAAAPHLCVRCLCCHSWPYFLFEEK